MREDDIIISISISIIMLENRRKCTHQAILSENAQPKRKRARARALCCSPYMYTCFSPLPQPPPPFSLGAIGRDRHKV